jgi:uncharacterized protein YgfB (UPF0149 family)
MVFLLTMETEVVVNFDDIADAFIRANMSGSPAELHGLLCGRVSGGEHLSEEDLVSTVAEFLDVPPERVEDFGDMLPELYQFTYGQICSSGFEFVPLLPDDDFSLNERLASLGEWCQGFLFGLGNSGLSVETELTGDIADALGDLASISHVSAIDDDNEEEDDEVSYTELVEYVRVAVLLIYAELNATEDNSSRTIH